MKDYLCRLPDPTPGRFHEWQLSTGDALIERFGTLEKAQRVLSLAREDAQRLADNTSASPAQREIAERIAYTHCDEAEYALRVWEEAQKNPSSRISMEDALDELGIDADDVIKS